MSATRASGWTSFWPVGFSLPPKHGGAPPCRGHAAGLPLGRGIHLFVAGGLALADWMLRLLGRSFFGNVVGRRLRDLRIGSLGTLCSTLRCHGSSVPRTYEPEPCGARPSRRCRGAPPPGMPLTASGLTRSRCGTTGSQGGFENDLDGVVLLLLEDFIGVGRVGQWQVVTSEVLHFEY